MFGYSQAIKDYERSLFDEPISEEELEEKRQAYQDHLDHMANNAIDEMRLSGEWWISFKSWPLQFWYRRRVCQTLFPRVIRRKKGV